MQTNLTQTGQNPQFTSINLLYGSLEQAGKRVSRKNLDKTLEEIKSMVERHKNHPIQIDIFTESHNDRLYGKITYKKGKFMAMMRESALSHYFKKNPVKFIKKCIERADSIRESYDI